MIREKSNEFRCVIILTALEIDPLVYPTVNDNVGK